MVVIPEGAPAFAAYAYDLNGEEMNTVIKHNRTSRDVLEGRVAVIDLGFGTADSFLIDNGELLPDRIQQSTDLGGGLKRMVHQHAVAAISEQTHSHNVNVTMVDKWLREWNRNKRRDYHVIHNGYRLNLAEIFTPLVDYYADWVLRMIPGAPRPAATHA